MLSHSRRMTASLGRDDLRAEGAIGEGEFLVDAGDAIVDDDIGVFAHGAQDLAAGEGGADAVAVGARVRGHDEAVTVADGL